MALVILILLALIAALWRYDHSLKQSTKDLARNTTPLSDPKLISKTSTLTAPLNIRAPQILVYDTSTINGLATADGRIILTQGVVSAYERGEFSADELTTIIAHELGHVAHKHTTKRIIGFMGQNALRTALSFFFARFIPFIGPMIANSLIALLSSRLSRSDEYEADAYATALLIKSGLGCDAQISLLQKLSSQSPHSNARPVAWLMSHPSPQDRICAILENINKWRI